MRLSALLWLGLAALHQSVNADQAENPVRRSRDASSWQFKGPYQPPQPSQWRRPQPYQPIIQQVPVVQPSPSIRRRPMRPIRPLSRQAYVPKMVNDARVVEPYKPVMMNGVVVQPYRPQISAPLVEPYKPLMMDSGVVQPYRPQITNDMLVQLLPTRGNRFAGLQAGQQAYAKPYEQAFNKISGNSVASSVSQTQNVQPTSNIAPQAVERKNTTYNVPQGVVENVVVPSILPFATETPPMITSCNHSTASLPQVATQTASPSVDASVSVPTAVPTLTPSSETIDMYDGFQIVQQPIILDAARLVQPYQLTMEDELTQPEVLVPGNVMVHEYLPTLEDARTDQVFAPLDGGSSEPDRPSVEVKALELQPYHPNSNREILSLPRPVLVRNVSEDVPASLVLSPYRPTLEEAAGVDASATMAPPPYRPTLEEPVDTDASATIVLPPYRPTLEEPVDVDASFVMAPPPYRPALEEPVDTDAAATIVLPPYRPTLEEPIDVAASATMVSQQYRSTLEEPVGVPASVVMGPPPYRPTLEESVDVDASAAMVSSQYHSTLEEAIRQPYIPNIDQSTSDAERSKTIDSIEKTGTSVKSTLSSESRTYLADVPQKDFSLDDSKTLEIQPNTTADSYSMGIESTTLTNDPSNDVIVLGSEDFAASTTTQDPIYTVTSEIVATTTTETLVKGFCAGLEVGIHRHPEKCDGIIRCDGVHTILMPSCPSGLLFNNLTKACDYPTSVPECGSSLANDSSVSANCNGHEHGAHVQDTENCGVFWRCVWDELVKMECPKGTFFNEMTSVCDWPRAVPTCEANGTRKVAESEKVTADEE